MDNHIDQSKVSLIINNKARIFYHGSHTLLPVGKILKGRGDAYKEEWKSLGSAYERLELLRPCHKIPHYEAVFMCSENIGEDEDNDFGLFDIDLCGGSTDYIFQLEALDKVFRHDMNWATQACCLYDQIFEKNSDISLIQTQIDDCIQKYWNGIPSEEPLWEYLTRSAKIIRCGDFETFTHIP